MKVFNLHCADGHRFEGWFGSDDDFSAQQDSGMIECPLCADKTITRLPSAPRLNVSSLREQPVVPADPQAQMQSQWMQAMRHLIDSTEDVGERFPEEARRIHYGEVEERGIRGQASREDAVALKEEGIEVVSFRVPAGLKGPMQ